VKKINNCSFCFTKKSSNIYKKTIRISLVFLISFFISQISGFTLVSASVIYQRNKTESVLNISKGTTMDTTNLWHMYFPAGITSITPPGNQASLVNTPGIYILTPVKYVKVSNAGGTCSNIGYSTSGPIIYYRDANNNYITNHIPKFISTDGGLTCTSTLSSSSLIPAGSKIAALYFTRSLNTNPILLNGSVNQGGQTIDGNLQSKYIKNGGIAFKLCDINGCDNQWNNGVILEKKITSFKFNGLTPNVEGIIDEVNHTITLNVPFGTDIKTIVPTITTSSGASINPSNNTLQDFSNPVTYTVTATDMSTETYTVTVVVDKPIHNPVILIPGITGTYLIKDYDDKTEIWPDPAKVILSIRDLFLKDLSLDIDGKENPEKPIIVGDIIRSIPSIGIHVFDRLISELIDNGGYVENADLFVFPYDWRKSTSQNAILLKEKIDKVILDTGYINIDIVAHSMGGLIAKKYIADNGQDKIDQLIFLGTPQLGAPKAFKALMFGDSMGFEKFSIPLLRPSIAKFISQNMPSVYELLPSSKYIENNGSYVTDASNEIIDLNSFDLNYSETKNLMIEKGRNPLMFPFAEDLHSSIDNLDLSGIEAHNFVGCGSKTIGGIIVKQKLSWASFGFRLEDDFDLKYVNGDETVPLESANKAIGAHIYFANGDTHGSLPSAEGVRQDVLSILKGEELQNYPNILTDASTCNISGKTVSVHSPVELHIYDEEGNHTGPNSDGDIEQNIAGVQYDIIEGEKFAFLPDGVNYKIVTEATDIGGYNLQIKDQNKNDEVTATYDWNLIPLETLQTKGEISVGPDYPALEYELRMDNDGDNIPDATISSNLPVDFKFYLNVLRKAVDLLHLDKKIEKDILNKIDKIEKEYDKDKDEKVSEKITKLLGKISSNKGKLQNISPQEKNVIVNSINTLLDILK